MKELDGTGRKLERCDQEGRNQRIEPTRGVTDTGTLKDNREWQRVRRCKTPERDGRNPGQSDNHVNHGKGEPLPLPTERKTEMQDREEHLTRRSGGIDLGEQEGTGAQQQEEEAVQSADPDAEENKKDRNTQRDQRSESLKTLAFTENHKLPR